jgi:hypothetical protein
VTIRHPGWTLLPIFALCLLGAAQVQGASISTNLIAHLSLDNPPFGVTAVTTAVTADSGRGFSFSEYNINCCGMLMETSEWGDAVSPSSVLAEVNAYGHQEGYPLTHPWYMGGLDEVNSSPYLVVHNSNPFPVLISLEWSAAFDGYVWANNENTDKARFGARVSVLRNGVDRDWVAPILEQSGQCSGGCWLQFDESLSGILVESLDPLSEAKFALRAYSYYYVQEVPEPATSGVFATALLLFVAMKLRK